MSRKLKNCHGKSQIAEMESRVNPTEMLWGGT